VAFKSRGGSKEEAYEVLKDVRVLHQWNEETEDLILEVMDIVSGFCSPSLRIWENE
jgi:NTP pyrophosphatase (non-canonical NTP hydrolase)